MANEESIEGKISYAQFHINRICSSVSRISPLELYLGRECIYLENEEPNKMMSEEKRNRTIKCINDTRERRLEKANKFRKEKEFSAGEIVWIHNERSLERGRVISKIAHNQFEVEINGLLKKIHADDMIVMVEEELKDIIGAGGYEDSVKKESQKNSSLTNNNKLVEENEQISEKEPIEDWLGMRLRHIKRGQKYLVL